MRVGTRVALIAAITGGVLAGCSGSPLQTANDATGATRRIVLYNTDTGEKVNVTYRVKGVYDPAAMVAISSLFKDRRSGEVQPVDPALMDLMSDIVAKLNLPDSTEIHVTSGYRSPSTNAILARTNPYVADDSYHLRAAAADMRIPGVPLAKVAEAAADLQRGGYALYASHVHVDTGPARTWGRHIGDDVLVAHASPVRHAGGHVQLASAKSASRSGNRGILLASARPATKPGNRGIILASAKGQATHGANERALYAKAVPAAPAKPGILLVRQDVGRPAAKPVAARHLTVKPASRSR